MHILENPLKVCSALPAVFSLGEKKIRNDAIRHSLVINLCYTMRESGVKGLDNSVFVEVAMKNYTQVYVKNSFEAAETYCKAFGAEITREFINEENTAYEHCELSVNGEGFLALAEAKNPCDIDVVHKYKWETMTFNVFEMGTEEAVYHAFQVLSDGGVIIEPIGELPWSKCCATIIDKYGVCWWISI